MLPACKQSSRNQQVVVSVSKGFGYLYLQGHSLGWDSEEWFWSAARLPITQGDLFQSKQPAPSIPTTQQRVSNAVGQQLVLMLKRPADPEFQHFSWYAVEPNLSENKIVYVCFILWVFTKKTNVFVKNTNKNNAKCNDVSAVSNRLVQFRNRQAPDLTTQQT